MFPRRCRLALLAALAITLPGCGKKSEEASKSAKGAPVVKLPSAEKPIDTDYFTEDFVAAVVVHPARVLSSDEAKTAYRLIDESAGASTVAGGFDKLTARIGLDIREVEQFIGLVDAGATANLAAATKILPTRGGNAQPGASFIVRTTEPIDHEKLKSTVLKLRQQEAAEAGRMNRETASAC